MTTFSLTTPYLYSAMVRDLFNPLTTPAEARLHAIIGLVGEYWEFQEAYTLEHQVEELGDFGFYLEALRQTCDWKPLGKPTTLTDLEAGLKIEPALSTLLDKAKKGWAYNVPATPAYLAVLEQKWYECTRWWQATCYRLNFSPDEMHAANYTKLHKRYPEGRYSDAQAQARADKPAGE